MIGSVERYSSSMRKKRFNLFGSLAFRIILIALLLYLLVSHFLVSTSRIESVSMSPTLKPADRVVVSSLVYGPRVPFSEARLPGLGSPQRGDLVVVRPPYVSDGTFIRRLFEPIAAFFTLQKATLHRDLYGARAGGSMVKRLIGMPGDTLRLKDFQAFIKPRGATQFVPEAEMLDSLLPPVKVSLPRGWDASLPLSGNAADIVLGEDAYFVLGDNRQESSDSRSWGPISGSRIQAKVIYRYWPPRSIGKP
jgi:signal peptidase I